MREHLQLGHSDPTAFHHRICRSAFGTSDTLAAAKRRDVVDNGHSHTRGVATQRHQHGHDCPLSGPVFFPHLRVVGAESCPIGSLSRGHCPVADSEIAVLRDGISLQRSSDSSCAELFRNALLSACGEVTFRTSLERYRREQKSNGEPHSRTVNAQTNVRNWALTA